MPQKETQPHQMTPVSFLYNDDIQLACPAHLIQISKTQVFVERRQQPHPNPVRPNRANDGFAFHSYSFTHQ